MCISPISRDILMNMSNFKYKRTDNSLMYNKYISPCLNFLVKFLPGWISPKLINFVSLCFIFIVSIISYNDGGFDFSLQLRPVTCIIIGTIQLIYLLLSNIDKKQAKRLGNYTPLDIPHLDCL